MAARPTKLTPDVQELIVVGINAGLTFRLSCGLAGVNPATFYRWLEKGETAKSGAFREFCDTVSRAKADSALRLVSQIMLQAPTDWRAAAFLLERRFPDDYGKRSEVTGKDGGPVKTELTGKDGGPVKTDHIFQPSPEVWEDMLRERAKFEALRDGDTDEDIDSL